METNSVNCEMSKFICTNVFYIDGAFEIPLLWYMKDTERCKRRLDGLRNR